MILTAFNVITFSQVDFIFDQSNHKSWNFQYYCLWAEVDSNFIWHKPKDGFSKWIWGYGLGHVFGFCQFLRFSRTDVKNEMDFGVRDWVFSEMIRRILFDNDKACEDPLILTSVFNCSPRFSVIYTDRCIWQESNIASSRSLQQSFYVTYI